jgi:lipoprotein-releasing system permease protein
VRLLAEIALGHLRTRRRQTLVSLTGVALGVGFFIAVAAMMQGFQTYFVAKVIDVSPHILVKDEHRTPPLQPVARAYPGGAVHLAGLKPEEELRGIKNGLARVAELNRLSGVAAAPVLTGQVILRYGSRDVSAQLLGIEPDRQRQVSNLERDMTVGALEDLFATANGVVLGAGLAERLGAEAGDSVTALSTAGIVLNMKVVGLYETGIVEMDNAQAYALLKKVQVLEDRPNVVNQIRLRLADVDRAEALARQIERRLDYRTESWQEQNQNVLGIFVIQNAIMYSTTGAILVVAAFGIFNIVSTVVLEKVRDIAILKSLGFDSRDVEGVFVMEGLLVGLAGMLLGWLLGWLLIELLATVRFDIEGFIKSEGFKLDRTFTNYLLAGGAAVAASTLAAWLPARKAARVDPVEIVRGAA